MKYRSGSNKAIEKTGIALIVCILIVYFTIVILKRPWIDCDLLEGVFSLNNYLHGLGFNQNFTVDAQYNIHQSLLSYWAPGQYVFPYIFATILHINISNAIIICNVFFIAIGFISYYYLLKHFNFCKTIIVISIFTLVSQRFFHGLLLKMPAVDIYLIVFTCTSVLLYEKYYNSDKPVKKGLYLLLLFFVFILGLFTKNSFLLFIIFISVFYFLYFIIRYFRNSKNKLSVAPIFKTMLPAIVAMGASAFFYFLYYAQGRIPFDKRYSASQNEFTLLKFLNVIIKPVVQTLGSVFSFDALLLRIPSPSHSYFSYTIDFTWQGVVGGAIIAAPIVYLVFSYYSSNKKMLYPYLAIFLITCYSVFFAVCVIKQSDVYAEDRLFLPMILIVLPIYAQALFTNKFSRAAFIIYLSASLVFSISAIPNTWKYYEKSSVVHRPDMISGFMIHSETEHFDELKQIGQILNNKFPANNLLITPSKEQFFLIQSDLPDITAKIQNADSLIAVNHAFLKSHNFSVITIVLDSGATIINSQHKVLDEQHMKDYSMYVLSTQQ